MTLRRHAARLSPTSAARAHPPGLRQRALPVLVATACLGLAACGGGGNDAGSSASSSSNPPAAQSTPVVLSGTAATGSAMVGATVRVIDARGVEVGRSAAVGQDGAFSVPLPAEARAPLVLEASAPNNPSLVSVLDVVVGASPTANVTPLTSLIAARLSPTGLPQGLVAQFEKKATATDTALPSADAIAATKQDVLRIIDPVRQALGDTTDPVTGRFAVGGVGHDKVLDSLTVTITAATAGSANIEVTVRTKRDDETPLPAVTFSSATPASALPQVDAQLRREDFGAAGTSARIEALVAELNRCYALPVADKVTSTTAQPRSAELVKDGPCKTMYFDANPSAFLDNGAVVGNGAANGLFSSDTLVFDNPVYEYTRAGVAGQRAEMVVFTVRWTNQRTLASDTQVVHAREDANGALKLYGNQYRHAMSVRPIVLQQTHVRTDSSHMDNLRSGYNFLVANAQHGGLPVYDRVEVVAPVGLERGATRDVFVLRPTVGFSHLRMKGKFLDTRSASVVWMGGGWVDPAAAARTATTSGRQATHPIALDGGGAVWVEDPQGRGWADDRLERLSHKSTWTFRYFLRDNTSDTPDAVQSMTTMSRAPSIGEARQQRLAQFTPATLQWLRAQSMDPAANMFWMSARPQGSGVVLGEPPLISLSWDLPAGALAPTNVNGFGRTTTSYAIGWEQRTGFDRLLSVPSTVREAALTCSTLSDALRPVLCHNAGNSDRYSMMTMFSEFELWGKDARQVEYSHSYATYIPSTRRTQANPVIERLNAAP